ncbi:hypothetical protein AAC387_Pa03g4558 [Persea americana]
MESVGSNSPRPDRRFNPSQLVEDRIIRALQHRLRLLHRSDADFFVLGATGNVYTVTLCMTPTCNCPDRTTPCKHILFVFLRVLGVSLDDACLRRRTLRPCQLIRLLGMPTSPEVVAGPRARERFHQLYWEESRRRREAVELRGEEEEQEKSTCPVCMEEMGKEERLVACGVCRNCLHEECFQRWKRSRGRRMANCVICRARWRERKEHERRYMNLLAYVVEEDGGLPGGGGGGGLCGI